MKKPIRGSNPLKKKIKKKIIIVFLYSLYNKTPYCNLNQHNACLTNLVIPKPPEINDSLLKPNSMISNNQQFRLKGETLKKISH